MTMTASKTRYPADEWSDERLIERGRYLDAKRRWREAHREELRQLDRICNELEDRHPEVSAVLDRWHTWPNPPASYFQTLVGAIKR